MKPNPFPNQRRADREQRQRDKRRQKEVRRQARRQQHAEPARQGLERHLADKEVRVE